ncbi:hypothetical protein GGH13_006236 [Coemansia sp. S155-1]|nr:hypothetical protein GGH13_006236 [Coemansia sp. S155-1]
MDTTTLSNEQLAFVAAKTFGKLWMPRGVRESSLQSFQAYCYELLRSTQIAVPIVMLTLLYVNKFKQRFPSLHGGHGSEYRMFVVALMLASKYLEDNTFTTQTWSEVSHLPAKELTIMQREFLVALEHRLHVPYHEYNAWIVQLQTIVLGGSNVSKNYGISLISPPATVYASASEACSPAEYLQVVPSPPSAHHHYHELPIAELLPSPPAKRMRPAATQYYSSGYGARPQLSRVCNTVEPLVIPARSVVVAPAMYTPPSSGVGFAQCDFTFTAPTVPVVAQGSMYYSVPSQSQPSVPNTAAAYHSFVSAAGVPSLPATQSYPDVSSALFSSLDRLPPHGPVHNAGEVDKVINMQMNTALSQPHSAQYQQHAAAGQFGGVCASTTSAGAGYLHYAQQQNSQMATPYSAAAAAAMLASQYPSLYYGAAPGFGFGPGPATFPIYTYGA